MKLTVEQTISAIRLLRTLADQGCTANRRWKFNRCRDDNIHGRDCDRCAAIELLHELELKTYDEERVERNRKGESK